jgi:hypothetical protein
MKEQILSKGNKIFSVTFIKKDGSTRRMVARLGVRKGVKGVGMSFSPSEKNLMVVFDMHKRGFRMINLETIVELK